MNYRVNPKNGDKLSILGYGCMRFGGNELKSFTGKVNKQKAENMILSAIEKGVNFFDTAYIYQGSEKLLGKILAKHGLREKVYIETKMPMILCKSKSDFDKFFNKQLERLQTDYIDYYLLHMLSDTKTWNTFCEWGIESWIQEKKDSGKIKQIGFSYHGPREEFLALLEVYDWDNVLIQYSYSDENFQAGITGLKKAAEKGIAVMIMEPLLGGRLATGLPQAAVSRFKEANPKMTPAQWALKWVWNKPEVTLLLSGMNEMKQLEENVDAAKTSLPNMLTQEEINVFQDVKNIVNKAYKINCTGCNYCMPCPLGVNIPGCFTAYNTHFAISKTTAMLQYSMGTILSQKQSYASLCNNCGKCEPLCPQHIPIAKSLKDVAKKMENIQFKLMSFFTKFFTRKK
ncbi:MAG: aldo/keto reductase [Spirochaetaceae bacterium]|nr:aldo/keto reductase [Spirochaetaceae bacterium]